MPDLTGIRMATGRLGRIVAFHMDPGLDLLKAIRSIVAEQGIHSGIILSGVGSLKTAVLRDLRTFPDAFPITDANRVYVAREEPIELLSLTGNIARRDDGTVVVHGHLIISSGMEDGRAYGGHLVEGSVVFSTMEIVLAETTGVALQRAVDPITGAAELWQPMPTSARFDSPISAARSIASGFGE